MQLSKDALEFIRLLNQNEVRYLIVGGWAVSLLHKPRFTKDIDILVDSTSENAAKILLTLGEFGFGSVGLSQADFEQPNAVIQLGIEPNRIDIVTEIAAVTFAEAWSRSILIMHQNLALRVIGISDLISNKEAVARDQDLVDAKNLRKLLSQKR